jgi:hypothetical protein
MEYPKKIDKLINMSESQLVSYVLKQHMDLPGVEKLQSTAEVALKRLPGTKHYRSKLRDAFLKLAKHYLSEKYYYEYVKALRKVLQVAPGNGEVIHHQLRSFQLLVDNYSKDYIKKDFEYLEFVIHLLRLKYSKGRYSKKVHYQTETILSRIALLKDGATKGAESKHTFQIKQLIDPFTLGLNEMQIDEMSDVFVQYVDEWVKEKEKKDKEK